MEYLTCTEIAKDLGLKLRTVQKYILEGFLPSNISFVGNKKKYRVNAQGYFEWKHRNFSGVKRGKISRYTRANKPLKIPEVQELVPIWLEQLRTGTLNGRVYSDRTIESYEYFIYYYLRVLGSKPTKPLISKNNLRKVFSNIPAKQYATKQKIYDSIMCFSKYLTEEGKLSKEERDAMKDLKPRRFLPAEKITLSEKQIEQAIQASQELQGNRVYDKLLTKTLIIFLRESGLRATELCNLKLEDIDLVNRVIYVWHGKGNKNRKVGITSENYEALRDYLKSRLNIDSPFFFVNKSGEQLTRNSLRLKWNRLSQHVGFRITCHSFRRSFVTHNVNKGRSLVQLQLMAGHSDIKTTREYCTTSEDEVVADMKGW